MSATKTLRARPQHALRNRVDVALLHFFICYRTWRCGLPVDWEHTARRMAEALGWDGGTGEDR